jgi:hypothetical protein
VVSDLMPDDFADLRKGMAKRLGLVALGNQVQRVRTVFRWGEQSLHLRRGVRLRLVNVGATAAINSKDKIFGYLICTVCGDSRSPLSSDKEWDYFQQSHKDRCGRAVTTVGFHADVVSDTLLPDVNSQTAFAYEPARRHNADAQGKIPDSRHRTR